MDKILFLSEVLGHRVCHFMSEINAISLCLNMCLASKYRVIGRSETCKNLICFSFRKKKVEGE